MQEILVCGSVAFTPEVAARLAAAGDVRHVNVRWHAASLGGGHPLGTHPAPPDGSPVDLDGYPGGYRSSFEAIVHAASVPGFGALGFGVHPHAAGPVGGELIRLG